MKIPFHPMQSFDNTNSRRNFLKTATGAVAGIVTSGTVAEAAFMGETHRALSLPLGICTSYDKAPLLKSLGYSFIEENVGRFLIPDKGGDEQYQKNFAALQAERFPLRSYVSFFPGTLKSVGNDTHHDAILQRADLALKRAKECGSANIVFGSGGSRFIPEGFDREKAKQQHIELSKKMALLAEKHGVTLAIEPLNRSETNFINSLAEGVEIIEAVNHPRFRLLCDIYHMMKDNEGPEQIVKYGKYITHCHIAEKQNRTAPGAVGDDFREYFKALKKIKYKGGLSIECRWKDFDNEAKKSIEVLKQQMSEV
ncbi:Xylose isomerase domain-containing protein TIM barrel [Runella slithyformis DSM 19594]|uniref:Xylose isomerase domain-containing protein TIM barrel n=2 Tax=Runella TaxID=105 RepID=A0A7U3ZHQ9_RUNSL|nr:Xylose isomerase domain-containing protein TIM barrel [Runella slithyformis DSM 19594]